jgi:prepilin signal peptidase PulO-like enzyme (type II secretory pathway)
MDHWVNFAMVAGGASAALVGLLFVSVSIRADTIAHSLSLKSRLAQVLVIFLGLLISCVLIALPNPADWVLGAELLATSVAMSAALTYLSRRAVRSRSSEPLEKTLNRLNPNISTTVLIGLSGVALLFGIEAGLFLLALAVVVGFVGGGLGAWLVLVRPDG